MIAYAAIGFTGPTLFEMRQRGADAPNGDTSHIILTDVLVLLLLLAIAFAAFALGKRFRAYSLATIIVLVVLGVATAPYGGRLAAGQATPGFGIVERVLIYSSQMWMAVLAIALLRRPRSGRVVVPPERGTTRVAVVVLHTALSPDSAATLPPSRR